MTKEEFIEKWASPDLFLMYQTFLRKEIMLKDLGNIISISNYNKHFEKEKLLLTFWDWYCKEKDVDSKYTKEEMIEAFLKTLI